VTDEGALLRAVIAEPDDDAPRLIYADWLDEHGQSERAEFIRVQVAAAGLPRDDKRLRRLWRIERQLLARNRETWTAWLWPVSCGERFVRGFVEYVTCRASPLLSYGAELFTLAPIRHMAILGAHGWAPQLSECACLSQLLTLQVAHNSLDNRDVRHLAGSPFLQPLTCLNLAHNRIGGAGATYLARSAYLGSLDDLYLNGNPIPPEGRAELRRRFSARVHF
jgi:uncharacterized protein (TIGR02996 family)